MIRFYPFLTLLLCPLFLSAADKKLELKLNRNIYFQIGDNSEWADPDYDHSDWDKMRTGRSWEEQGYPGYDGFAWYRIEFDLKPALSKKALLLNLGFIDDIDRVWINGHYLNGRGTLPPEYKTAYDQRRIYELPHDLLKFGEKKHHCHTGL